MTIELEATKARAASAEAHVTYLQSLYTHKHAIAGEMLTRALAAEAENRHLTEEWAEMRAQVVALAAELERLHVGLSKLQDGMPDYLDEAVQALIDNEPADD